MTVVGEKINHLEVSAITNGSEPLDDVNFIPPERVAQIHIAGHSEDKRIIGDADDQPVIGPVWRLYKRAAKLRGGFLMAL